MKRAEHLARQAERVAALERAQRPDGVSEETLLTLEAEEIRRADELEKKRRAEAFDLPEARPLDPGNPSNYLCWGHRWLGTPRIPGGPPSPCPTCLAETRPESDEELKARLTPVTTDPKKARVTSYLDGAWAEYEMKLGDAGVVLHGSHAEQLALDRMDELREQDLERERQKSHRGRVLFARIEDGGYVEYRAVRYRAGGRWRERLDRVAPEEPSVTR
jgi:hypothetical protein